MLNSNAMHSVRAIHGCTVYSFVFSPELIIGNNRSVYAVKYVKPLQRFKGFDFLRFKGDSDSSAGFLDAFQCMKEDKEGYEFTVREQLSHIVLEAFVHYKDHMLQENEQDADMDTLRISHMLQYIHDHFAEEITLSDIGGAANIGKREALRCFKRTIAESPIQYLMRYRLMKSADMLKNDPEAKISVIAEQCGFNSPSYFSKKFRHFYHIAPSMFAEKTKKHECRIESFVK